MSNSQTDLLILKNLEWNFALDMHLLLLSFVGFVHLLAGLRLILIVQQGAPQAARVVVVYFVIVVVLL